MMWITGAFAFIAYCVKSYKHLQVAPILETNKKLTDSLNEQNNVARQYENKITEVHTINSSALTEEDENLNLRRQKTLAQEIKELEAEINRLKPRYNAKKKKEEEEEAARRRRAAALAAAAASSRSSSYSSSSSSRGYSGGGGGFSGGGASGGW